MLEIRLFGSGQAYYGEQAIPGFPRQQHGRLLCYLLLNRRYPHDRERLAAIFWGEQVTSISRSYLRNALWRLRQALAAANIPVERYLDISDESVSFLPSDDCWLDVEAFEQAVRLCEQVPGHELTEQQAVDLEAAVGLYSGDLLDGMYDDWCLYDRERLRLMFLGLLDRLMIYHEYRGHYESSLAYGQRILERQPTHEAVHCRMMRLFWLMGNHGEALAQYKRCAQVLREELGIDPMSESRLLYHNMLGNEYDPLTQPLYAEDALPLRMQERESFRHLAERALAELRRLQAVSDETSAELRRIEQLLNQALLRAG